MRVHPNHTHFLRVHDLAKLFVCELQKVTPYTMVVSFPQGPLRIVPLTPADTWPRLGCVEKPFCEAYRDIASCSSAPFTNKQPPDVLTLVLLPRTSTSSVLQELQLLRKLPEEQGKSGCVFLGWVISEMREGGKGREPQTLKWEE